MDTAPTYEKYGPGPNFRLGEKPRTSVVYDEFYQPQEVPVATGSSTDFQATKSDSYDSGYPSGKSQYNLNRGPSKKSAVSSFSQYSYSSEDINAHPNRALEPHNDTEAPLFPNTSKPNRTESHFEDLEYADPDDNADPFDTTRARPMMDRAPLLSRLLGDAHYPLAQRIEDKKRGIGRQRYPFVVWALTAVMAGVFINELVVNLRAQGTPVSFKPVINPMLGPSSSALINLGARFPPCMKLVQDVPLSLQLPCLNDTANPPDRVCPLEDICGFGGFHGKDPNQWFRFITPIFLHAGFVHIFLNMLAQYSLSGQIEREMGSGGFIITYFSAGIFGNVLGGNFSLVGAPSLGASGAIFGTLAVTWVDLFAHWRYLYRPRRRLAFMTIELLVGVAIGYIPFVDNFAHLGGFFMGLLVGTTFYPVISTSKRHRLVMWTFRLIALPLTIILFVVLIRNFYTSDPYAACSGCRYLSCFPTNANNHCKGTGLTTTTTNTNTPV